LPIQAFVQLQFEPFAHPRPFQVMVPRDHQDPFEREIQDFAQSIEEAADLDVLLFRSRVGQVTGAEDQIRPETWGMVRSTSG